MLFWKKLKVRQMAEPRPSRDEIVSEITGKKLTSTVRSFLERTRGFSGEVYRAAGKRLFDTLAALVAIAATLPVLFTCMIAVWADSRGPIFFRQWRTGQDGKPFRLLKFRTMVQGAEKRGPRITSSCDSRITRVGKLLRKTKLDEMPQLLNVIRGEMSLVGPRPEVPEYTAKYNPAERRVLDAKPGITGPASLAFIDEERVLSGRSDKETFYINTLMPRKLKYDLAYCSNISFSKDLSLLLKTIGSVLAPRRVTRRNAEAHTSAHEVHAVLESRTRQISPQQRFS